MSKQHSEQVKAVFLQAADLPQEQRGAFLDTACQGEPALLRRCREFARIRLQLRNWPA